MNHLLTIILSFTIGFIGIYGRKYSYVKSEPQESQEISSRNPKAWNFNLPFVKVIIPPDPCGMGMGTNMIRDGVCVPRGKCQILGGTMNGDCGFGGFGECCRFAVSCNATLHEVNINKEVVVINSPSPIDTDCTFSIIRKKDYCGVRLDYMLFNAAPADSNGTCTRDSLSVRGSTTIQDGFQVCGLLTGQHMYLEFDKSGNIDIIPIFSATSGGTYQIVATQIPCVSPYRVPRWCLQYFNTTKGQIRSFGYPGQQQSNQEYTICIGGNANTESVTYGPCRSADTGFISNTSFYFSTPPDPLTAVSCRDNRDWVQLNGKNQLCRFQDIERGVRATYKPFTINVHFDDRELDPLPCIDEILLLTADTCTSLTSTSSVCINTYYEILNCRWDITVNRCVCPPKFPPVADLEADYNNTGFCLEYTQSTRR